MDQSPQAYRIQAVRCRDLAAGEVADSVRATLLEVASQYDRMADRVERREGDLTGS